MAHQASVLTARPDLVVDDIEILPDARPRRRLPDVARPLLLYLLSRLVVLVAAVPAAFGHDPGFGPWPTIQGGSALERVFAQWDGAWYLWVAGRGYPSSSQYYHHLSDVAFFPVFPALVRAVSSTTRLSTLHAAVGLSFVLGAAATVARLAARRAPRRQGEGDAGDGSVRVLPRRVRAVDGLRRDVDDPRRGGLSAVSPRSPMGPGGCCRIHRHRDAAERRCGTDRVRGRRVRRDPSPAGLVGAGRARHRRVRCSFVLHVSLAAHGPHDRMVPIGTGDVARPLQHRCPDRAPRRRSASPTRRRRSTPDGSTT